MDRSTQSAPRSRRVVAALFVATVVLAVTAGIALATRPHTHSSRHTAAAPSTSAPPTPSRPAARAQPPLEPVGKVTEHTPRAVTYVVRPGDNLTVIAAWFKLHGYGDLYARNRAIIGADPDLIRPGQRIVVTSTGATVGG